jgi:hypothetical protein
MRAFIRKILLAFALAAIFSAAFSTGDADAQVHASCKQLFKIKSINSDSKTKITFINNSGMYRSILWLDFSGQPKDYAGLNSGERALFDTYLTHPWMIATGPGDCLQIVLPQPGGSVVNLTSGNRPSRSENNRPSHGEEGGRMKGCPPGTRSVPETDNCVPLGAPPSNHAELLGTWSQTESNAGHCATCTISFRPAAGGKLTVTSNNGWSAQVSRERGGDDNRYRGAGSWGPGGGAFAHKNFGIEFYLTPRRLHMTINVNARGRQQEIRAAFVR